MLLTSIHLESTLLFLTLTFVILTILNHEIIPTITIIQKKKKIMMTSIIVTLSLFVIKLVRFNIYLCIYTFYIYIYELYNSVIYISYSC